MGARIPDEKINEIRQAVDIVDVISEYVQLKKQGRNYFGLCPFHSENTPSFSVSPEKQIYYCFGCGAGGNVFSFLMEHDGLSFQEAVMKLAEKANITLELSHPVHSGKSAKSRETEQMIAAHELLCKFYHHILVNTKDGQHALEYLHNRGFTREQIEKYQIGYALNSRDFAYKLLTERNFSPSLLEKAGLIIRSERDGDYFDRFRNRIMFPIFDGKGNTVAFSGRALGEDEPKYLNSPETPVFDKSKILYNFHLARPFIRKMQQVVLFEGFADCIAAERSGVENGVATMGTSLTAEHVSLIRRNTDTVTICYDSDQAGKEAALRAGRLLVEAGCQVRVALMEDGLDPDEYIRKFGAEKFRDAVFHSSLTFTSFKLLYLKKGKDFQNEGDRLQYIDEALKEISLLDSAVERDYYLRQLADEFSLSLEALKMQLRQFSFADKKKSRQKQSAAGRPLFLQHATQSLRPAYYNAERRLIAHMVRDPDLAYKVREMLGGEPFNVDEHQAIITYLFGYYEKGFEPDSSLFINYLEEPKLKKIVADIEMMAINDHVSEEELSDYVKQVLNYRKMLKIKEKEMEGKEAERRRDYKKAAEIAQQIIEMKKALK